MNSLNSILLEGNLTRAPEVKQTPKGSYCCTFSVASNRFYRMGESMQKEVSFFEIESWNSLAERCSQELAKGRGVRVVGRLKQDRWVDTDGQNRAKVKIVAEHVEFKPVFTRDKDEAHADEEAVLVGSPSVNDTGTEDESPI